MLFYNLYTNIRQTGRIIVFLLLLNSIRFVQTKCVMYDTCHRENGQNMNCPNPNKEPVKVTDEASLKLLESFCPYMGNRKNEPLCCSSAQLEDMAYKLRQANGLLSRCPSCSDNFQKLWCEFTCSPRQSDFVTIQEVFDVPNSNKTYVNSVRYHVAESFATSLHESCKNVHLPNSDTMSLSLMCGELSHNETCSRDKWLKYMGTQDLSYGIPLNIDFVLHNSNDHSRTYMTEGASKCNQAARLGMSKCSRYDCPSVDDEQEFFPEDQGTMEVCSLLGVGCTSWFLGVSCIIFVAILFCVVSANVCKTGEEPLPDYKGVETNPGTIDSVAFWIEKQIEISCSMLGEFTCRKYSSLIAFGLFVFVVSSFGILFVNVTSDPVELWSAPNSRARIEKKFFDTHFAPFYRIEQLTVYPKNMTGIQGKELMMGPIFHKDFLKEVFNLVNSITNLVGTTEDGFSVSLADICHRPLGSTFDCLINSPTNYMQHNVTLLDKVVTVKPKAGPETFDYYSDEEDLPPVVYNYLDHFYDCIKNPYSFETHLGLSCHGSFGGPLTPLPLFGGSNATDYFYNSTAINIAFVISGRVNKKKALAWEESFINHLKEYKHESVQVSFMAERSISDEIQRESESDGYTIMISCILMVSYVIFALGTYNVDNNRLLSILIHSKLTIGVGGMFCIFASVISSIGVFSMYGMIVPQSALVVQFFVMLVIGANRMFSVVSAVMRLSAIHNNVSTLMFHVCGEVFPSFILCTVAQSSCFFIGSIWGAPAVRCFCLIAALGMIFQLMYFSTFFTPLVIIDYRREKNGYPELCCFRKYPTEPVEYDGYIKTIIQKYAAPFLMRPAVKTFVVALTCSILIISPIGFSQIRLGLDQKMAVPEDSYVFLHFKNMDKYLNVGPPVYFVVQGDVDFSKKVWQDKFCTLPGCAENSVGAILNQAIASSNKTHLAGSVLNWIDNYLEWLNPDSGCCKVVTNSTLLEFCPSSNRFGKSCEVCDSLTNKNRPSEDAFYKFITFYLQDPPNRECMKGGVVYKDSVYLDPRGHFEASHFMTYHRTLRNSSDFISAMEGARMVARKIEHELNYSVKVFPYSSYYVFYDHYLTHQKEAAAQLIIAMSAVFGTVSLLSGLDAVFGMFLVLASVCHLFVQVSVMWLWNIEFNPITAVNLIMSVGASLEFFIPMIMAFSRSLKCNRDERAKEALTIAGPTVFSGIFLTMLIGTIVLAFSHSQFFKVFYFRMFLGSVLSGCYFGLFVLPIMLSYCGPVIKHWRFIESPNNCTASPVLSGMDKTSSSKCVGACNLGESPN
ncbi:unnamed protein product [Auanema sp. JU1783]|nr:unnamed protein product [Auanema sp. JU1783]